MEVYRTGPEISPCVEPLRSPIFGCLFSFNHGSFRTREIGFLSGFSVFENHYEMTRDSLVVLFST